MAGLAVLAAAVLRGSARLVPWALAGLAGEYALALILADGDLDSRAGFVAGGLLLTGELAVWAVEARTWPLEEREAARSRAAGAILLALCAAAVGTLVVAAGAAALLGGTVLQAAGIAGAVAALALLAALARSPFRTRN